MGVELEFNADVFRVPDSGFDSRNRFYRQSINGNLAFSGGRTMVTSGTATALVGQPWCGHRYSQGAGLLAYDQVLDGTQGPVEQVNPNIVNCTT